MSSETPKAISPAEWEVMKVLWQGGDMAARDVFAALPNEADWAYKTVKTLLSRLVAKGAISYRQIGNSYLYKAVANEAELTRKEVRSVFDRITRGAVSPVLAHFIDEADLSESELRNLREILDRKLQQRNDNRSDGDES